jgi:hypothetical protein
MRRRFIPLLLLILSIGLLAACSRGKPVLTVETLRLDLGDVTSGMAVTRDVRCPTRVTARW